MSNMDQDNRKSSSPSSISSCPLSELPSQLDDKTNTTTSIPIASIKKNRKLTLGEIQTVHDCTLIDNKLAFIVTLRATNSVAKVFRSDINTNSLRHAVPFSTLCHKHNCKNVNELEQKLIANHTNNDNNMDNSDNSTNTIEIACDSSTSLKHLACIASVVNNNNNNNNMCDGEETESESEEDPPYNLRSKNKKRKFRELKEEDENSNCNNLKPKYKRPHFLRAIPNTIGVGPSLSPRKLINALDINRNTVSAPNTPLLNGNGMNRMNKMNKIKAPIINLIHSPLNSTKTLQFPQISLPQNQIQNFTLFPALKVLNKATINTNINQNSLQQLQQLILFQKQMNSNNQNDVNVIRKITNLKPIQMLPRLETEIETETYATHQPPAKKVKLVNGKCMNISNITTNQQYKASNLAEPFWNERLRLDGILNTHKVCEKQMADLDSMRNWTHIIRTLQGQRLELLKVQQSIVMQWQSYHIEANRYNLQLQQIIKHNEPKSNEYMEIKCKIDEYKKQISEIYEKISKLSVKRKVLEKQLQLSKQQMTKSQINMQQINNATKQFRKFINDRKEKATKLVEFMKTIDVISKQYCKSVENMQEKVSKFEPNYTSWNSGEVVTWFENIDKGLLNKSELFLKFKRELITNNVSGADLNNLNDFSLKMMGLKNDKERALIIEHLNKLLIHSKGMINADVNKTNEANDNDNKNDDTNEL